ncbi:spermatogenesis-associated protein 31A6-like [Tamandua tetradactyla]|uniref:spermatogenesis-associated protein 31A6-like n=1 Tax=Tamandua tetradactyla TaxID=48850 RepID=UPI0040541A19
MQNHFFPLRSAKTSKRAWLGSSFTSWFIIGILILLCGVGLCFLLLPHLQSILSLSSPKKYRHSKKCHVQTTWRIRRRRKGGALKACRDCLEELKEAQGLISLLQNHLKRLHDKGSFHQPSGEVCETVPAEAHLPCEEPMKDAAPIVPPFVVSTPPLTNSPIPLPSTLPAEPPKDQFNLRTIPLSIVPESSPGNRFCLTSSIPAIFGLDRSSRPISALFWWWAAAKALFFPTSTHGKFPQDHLSQHPKKVSFWGDPATKHVEACGLSFLSPDVQRLLEVQITKRVELKILKEKGKDGLFPKQMSTDYHLNSLGNMLKSLGDKQDTTEPQTFWSTKGKSEQLLNPQQFSYPRTLGDHLQCKYSQLFWGLPSLHSESLVASAWISESSSPKRSPTVLFNGNCRAYPVKMQAKSTPLLLQPHTLPQPKAQPQMLTSTMAQSQSSLPVLSSAPPLIKHCGVSCPTYQNKIHSSMPSKTQHVDWPLLQQQLKCRKVERSQEDVSSFTTGLPQNSQKSQVHRSVSFIPVDVPRSHDSQTQLQQHLQNRFIKDHWGLPCRIQKSMGLKQTQVKSLDTSQAKEQHGPSRPSLLPGQRSKDAKTMGSKHTESIHVRGPAKFQLRKDVGKRLGQIHLSKRSESSPVRFLETDSKMGSKYELTRCPRSKSGNNLPRDSEKKLIENVLKVHLGRKLCQIIEGRIPVSVRRSWFSVSHTLPKSDSQTEIRNLVSSKNRKSRMNTSQEISFFEPSTQQKLEAHIIRFRVRQRWGLPHQILKLSEVQTPSLQQSSSPASPNPTSVIQIAKDAKLQGENSQSGQEEKAVKTRSSPTLESPLPTQSPACEDVQRVRTWVPPRDGPWLSEAPLTGQEGRQPPQPLTPSTVGGPGQSKTVLGIQRDSLEPTPNQDMVEHRLREVSWSHAPGAPSPGVAMLETDVGSQSSMAKETREAIMTEGSPDFQPPYRDGLRTSELADSPVVRVELSGLGAPRSSKSPPSPRTAVGQVPKEKLPSKFMFKGEAEKQKHLQACPPDMLLQDHAKNVILQDYASDTLLQGCRTDAFLDADIKSSQMPQGHPQSVSNADISTSQVLFDLLSARNSSLGPQDPKTSKFQVLSKSQGHTSAPTWTEDCRKPKPEEHEDGFSELRSCQARKVSQPGHVREVVDTLERKYIQLLPEIEQIPPEHFRKRVRHYLQCLYPNKKTKEQEENLPKDKPKSASVQSQGPVKNQSLLSVDNQAAEAQALTAAVGQILVEKLSLQNLELSQQGEEIQVLVGEGSSYHRAPPYSEQRRVMSDRACSHHTTSESQRCRSRERQVRGQNCLKVLRLTEEKLDSMDSAPCPHREPVSSISSLHHHPEMPGAARGTHHYPRHCIQRTVLSDPPENTSPAFPGRRNYFQGKGFDLEEGNFFSR